MLASVIDVTARRGIPQATLQAALDERLEFERLVGELGAEFVDLRPDEVDRAIEDALGRLVRMLGLDRSALFQVGTRAATSCTRISGRVPAGRRRRRASRHANSSPGISRRSAPASSSASRRSTRSPTRSTATACGRLGTKSSVTVPLMIGGRDLGGADLRGGARDARRGRRPTSTGFRVVALHVRQCARAQGRRTSACAPR